MRVGMLPIDLARKAGVNVTTIYALEAANNPTLVTLLRVADALGVPVGRLFAEEERGREQMIADSDSPDQNLAVRVAQMETELRDIKAALAPGKRARRRK
jgi:transcriptional regulator with XRE-family HTH domain